MTRWLIEVQLGLGGVPCPKPETIRRVKGRKDRAEAKVKQFVREQCVERDGYCRIQHSAPTLGIAHGIFGACEAPSQWCHMHARRRSQTRNLAPDVRHTTQFSFMACQKHHDQYDGRRKPRLVITALTQRGADGPLKVRLAKG